MSERPVNFDYQRYLASREWALLKRQVRERSGGNCERCHYGRYQQTNHLTYERIGHEDLEDLQAVCRACHEYLSGVSDRDPASEAVLGPRVRFARYENPAEKEWYAYIQSIENPDNTFRLRVSDDGDGLFAVIAGMLDNQKVWHPMVISGHIREAFDAQPKDAERPPFIEQLSTIFFPCGEDCDLCPIEVAE